MLATKRLRAPPAPVTGPWENGVRREGTTESPQTPPRSGWHQHPCRSPAGLQPDGARSRVTRTFGSAVRSVRLTFRAGCPKPPAGSRCHPGLRLAPGGTGILAGPQPASSRMARARGSLGHSEAPFVLCASRSGQDARNHRLEAGATPGLRRIIPAAQGTASR